jgi:hypothetical protein
LADSTIRPPMSIALVLIRKTMTIKQQIKYHLEHRKFCKVKRQIADDSYEFSNGYIVDYSKDFILIQEADEFRVLGYLVFPISTITQVRFNNNDKYYDKIMQWEKQVDNVSKKHEIDLTDWTTIFRTIKKSDFNVIIENEDPDDKTFDIGPIIKVTKAAVYIQYFNAKGYLDTEISKITYDKITIAKFDDHYVNVISKYLRLRKSK